MGGGSDIESALVGIAASTILNAATKKLNIQTLISITTITGELHFLCRSHEPYALRIGLAKLFARMRHLDMELVTSHFQKLDTLYKSNISSKEVYDRIKTEFSGRDNYLPKSGYLISSVSHSGTAQKSGVLVGDLLVKYNTKAITSDEDLSNAIKSSTLTGNTILVARNGQLFSLACDPGRLGIDGRIV